MQNTENRTNVSVQPSLQDALNKMGLQLDEETNKISVKDLSSVCSYIEDSSYSLAWDETREPIYPDTDRLIRELLENAKSCLGGDQQTYAGDLQNAFLDALNQIDAKKNERYLSEVSFSDPEAIIDADHLEKSEKLIYKGREYYPAVVLLVDERYYFRRRREEGSWWIRTGDAHLLLPRSILTIFSYDPKDGFSWIHAENTTYTKKQPLWISQGLFDVPIVWKETSIAKAGLYPLVDETGQTNRYEIPVEDARKILVENPDRFDNGFNRFLLVPNGDIRVYPDFPEGCSNAAKPCKSLTELLC